LWKALVNLFDKVAKMIWDVECEIDRLKKSGMTRKQALIYMLYTSDLKEKVNIMLDYEVKLDMIFSLLEKRSGFYGKVVKLKDTDDVFTKIMEVLK